MSQLNVHSVALVNVILVARYPRQDYAVSTSLLRPRDASHERRMYSRPAAFLPGEYVRPSSVRQRTRATEQTVIDAPRRRPRAVMVLTLTPKTFQPGHQGCARTYRCNDGHSLLGTQLARNSLGKPSSRGDRHPRRRRGDGT